MKCPVPARGTGLALVTREGELLLCVLRQLVQHLSAAYAHRSFQKIWRGNNDLLRTYAHGRDLSLHCVSEAAQ